MGAIHLPLTQLVVRDYGIQFKSYFLARKVRYFQSGHKEPKTLIVRCKRENAKSCTPTVAKHYLVVHMRRINNDRFVCPKGVFLVYVNRSNNSKTE